MTHYNEIPEKFEPEIGDTVDCEGETLICKLSITCDGCFFNFIFKNCMNIKCSPSLRKDKKSIILTKL